jgi:uncharacterized protein YndB with AHSA1/START domain
MSAIAETTIEADPKVPIIRMCSEFKALPEHLFRAHTDPRLFVHWAGPKGMHTRVEEWDAQSSGSWRYASIHDVRQFASCGCFHDVRPDPVVQTLTFDAPPYGVALEPLRFENPADGGDYCTQSLVDRFEDRAAWRASGIEVGVNAGYAKLEEMIANGTV